MRVCAEHTVNLRFSIKQKLEFGKRLCVVGSPKELGVWNASIESTVTSARTPTDHSLLRFAVRQASESTCSLEWSDGDFWVGNLTIAPGPVEFKLVQVSDEEIIWPEGQNVSLLIPDQASGVDVTGEGDSLNLTILGNSSGAEERSRGVEREEEVNETPSGGGTPFFPSSSASASASAGQSSSSSGVEFETLKIGRLEELTVAELKKLLKERGLPVSGKKAELIERLSS